MSSSSGGGEDVDGAADLEALNAHMGGFNDHLGLVMTEVTPDRVLARWTAGPPLHQPYGLVHGGAHCGVVESLASVAAATWLQAQGDPSRTRVVGVSNTTDFFRGVRDGDLRSEATPVHRGRSQQVWQVETRDDQDRLVARGQVRLQNLDG